MWDTLPPSCWVSKSPAPQRASWKADLHPVNDFFFLLLGADLETGACNHLLSSRMKGKDDPCLYRIDSWNRVTTQSVSWVDEKWSCVCRKVLCLLICHCGRAGMQELCSPAVCTIPYMCLSTCALPGASAEFPRGPGNLSSVITKYKHDNLGPNAYRRL